MSRYLVYVSPAVGHTLPLVPGLLELQQRGHEVRAVVIASLVDTLREAGLDAVAVSPAVTEVEITDYKSTSDAERLRSGQVDLIARGRRDGPDLARHLEEFEPDAVLVDTNAYGARTVAEASGLPWAVLMPSVVPVPGAGIPPYGVGLKPMSGPLGAVRDRVGWKVMEKLFGKAMLPGLTALRAEHGLDPFDSPLVPWRPPYEVIALTSEPLEYARVDLPPTVRLVGTQPWDVPAERPAYLDEPGHPWVLVTCSTEYQGDDVLARLAVEALAGEPVRVLITMADAFDAARLPTAANVRVERFVPHGHVVPEAAAVVCHGGMGIVTRAASAGVPTVVVPFGRDQPEIARRVTEAGAGVSVKPKGLTAEKLRDAVRRATAMRDDAQRVAKQLDPTGAPGRFADAVEGLGR